MTVASKVDPGISPQRQLCVSSTPLTREPWMASVRRTSFDGDIGFALPGQLVEVFADGRSDNWDSG